MNKYLRLFVMIVLFILLNTLNFEFLINRSQNTMLTILAGVIFLVTAYFLIFKPIKKLL